ncbi:complement binding [Skunkpox virus]|uniref:Complement control protein C3 n=1 Tax=Skunkpox virus TaxID=160796 RepID=A0A1C9KBH4_9POXV|nr:complement binding [Skunkpox virus]AOP31503.1 complement binding [Skunkpox virus]
MKVETITLVTLLGIGCALSCTAPTRPINMKFKNTVDTSYNVGDTVEFTCLPGYRKSKIGPIYVKCTDNGWTRVNDCIKRKCPSPRDIDNGQLEVTSTDFGSNIVYSCNSGYKMIGESVSYCELGHTGSLIWNPEPPICDSVKCQSPPSIADGSHNGYSDIYTEGTVVTYTCNTGYSLIGEANIVCMDGEWSEVPTCQIVKCTHPIISHGFMSSGFKRHYSYNDEVHFTCKHKYKLNGSSRSTCSPGNEWKPALPTCERE